jgi:hypothetical protein
MFLRKITQEVSYPRPPQQAFDDVQQALARIGKVKKVDEASGTLTGSVSGGGWVNLQVAITPAEGGSRLALRAGCDDVWGAGARRGISQFLAALPDAQGNPPPAPAAPKLRSFEDGVPWPKKVSVGIFLAFVSLASLDVAWKGGMLPLSAAWLYGISAGLGAVTGLILAQRRYLLAGLVGGAVSGLCGSAFSVLVFGSVTYLYKIVAFFTTVLGCLPGLFLFAALRALQDYLFPAPKSGQASRDAAP